MSSTVYTLRLRAAWFKNPDYQKSGFPAQLIQPLAEELEQAANEIEALREENKQLQETLKDYKEVYGPLIYFGPTTRTVFGEPIAVLPDEFLRIRNGRAGVVRIQHYRGSNSLGTFGISGDLSEALAHDNAPQPTPIFEEITRVEYENSVFDMRFEKGRWVQ